MDSSDRAENLFCKTETQCASTHHSRTHIHVERHTLSSQECSTLVCEMAGLKRKVFSWVLNSDRVRIFLHIGAAGIELQRDGATKLNGHCQCRIQCNYSLSFCFIWRRFLRFVVVSENNTGTCIVYTTVVLGQVTGLSKELCLYAGTTNGKSSSANADIPNALNATWQQTWWASVNP